MEEKDIEEDIGQKKSSKHLLKMDNNRIPKSTVQQTEKYKKKREREQKGGKRK